ncbi:hypothetical protein R5R35_007799 [Gryllus longicercus]|uniref:Cytochrome P450 n=1 Tax=Gryllus longicercus TaxID=2509291 RepID=A0AAN9W7J5_9ORTH
MVIFTLLLRALKPLSWLITWLVETVLVVWRLAKARVHLIILGAKFPGPPAFPLFGNLLAVFCGDSEALTKYIDYIWNKYGNLHRSYIGPVLVVTTGRHQDHEKLLASNDYLNKGLIYFFMKPWLGDGLLMSSGEKWHSRRKMLTPAFHFKILDQFVPVFNSNGEEFIRQLRKRADGRAFDIWPLCKLLTLDVICETIMGVRVNAQTISNSPYVTAVNEISAIIYNRGMRPWEYPPFIFRFTKLGRRHQECLDILHSTTEKVIRERRTELEKISEGKTLDVDELGRRRRVAFLDLLLLIARDGSLSDADIREEVDTFMFEGHDTTAAAISFTVFLLSRHPAVQEKVLEELDSIFDTSKPLDPTIHELSELKYLDMVIKESLRIFPPVGAVSRQITSDFRLASSPLTVPSGAMLFLTFHLLHRDPEVFPEPNEFDPQRFAPEETVRRHPFAYLPFSAGSRNCIGQRFAMLELKSVLAKLIWNFRILPAPDFEPILVWEIITKSKNGIFVRLEERSRKKMG